jgi:O-antigen/teichoic acid export membrane protein
VTQDTLTSRTIHGLKWSVVAQILNAATTVATVAVLARLLDPPTFGLVAMGLVVMRFVQYFAQMGVGAALVQKSELTSDDIRAGVTSSLLLGAAACGLLLLAAPLVRPLFPNPQVVPVLRVMTLNFVLNGATITSLALLRRGLAFKALAIVDTATYVVGYGATSIVLAAVGLGVWSLVYASLVQSAMTAVTYHALTRHPVRPLFAARVYRTLYSYGARVSVNQFFEFLSANMDTMWAGHYLSTRNLGIYTRSYTLVSLPNQYLGTSFTRVLFPSFSRVQGDTTRLRDAYLPAVMVAVIIGTPLRRGVAAAAAQVVDVVLGHRWHAGVPVAGILAIGQVFVGFAYVPVLRRVLDTSARQVLRAYLPGATAGACTAALIGLIGVAGSRLGLPAAATLAVQMVAGLVVVVRWLLRSGRGAAWREMRRRLVGPQTEPPQGRLAGVVRRLDALAARGAVEPAGQSGS